MGYARDLRRAIGHGITQGQIKLSRALGNILNRLDVEKIGPSWAVSDPGNDLHPTSGEDPGIGTGLHPVNHIAIGDLNEPRVDGGIIVREQIQNGGVLVIGLRDYDPDNPVLTGNAPVEIDGIAVLIGGGNLLLEVDAPLTEDHELLIGESQLGLDGRYFSPLVIGPKKVYGNEQLVEDTRDLDVLDVGQVTVLTMVLTDDYPANVSSFNFGVYLENLGRRDTDFTVRILVDSVVKSTYPIRLNGNAHFMTDGGPVLEDTLTGQTVTLTVEAASTHQHSQGWVRGSIQPSSIHIKK